MDDTSSNPSSAPTADTTPPVPAGDNPPIPVVELIAAEPGPADEDDVNKDIAPEFELVTITYRGASWTVPKDRGQWDMNVQFEFEEGRRLRGFLVLLGGSADNVDVARRQVYAVCRTNAEVDEFMDTVAETLNKECTG